MPDKWEDSEDDDDNGEATFDDVVLTDIEDISSLVSDVGPRLRYAFACLYALPEPPQSSVKRAARQHIVRYLTGEIDS